MEEQFRHADVHTQREVCQRPVSVDLSFVATRSSDSKIQCAEWLEKTGQNDSLFALDHLCTLGIFTKGIKRSKFMGEENNNTV